MSNTGKRILCPLALSIVIGVPSGLAQERSNDPSARPFGGPPGFKLAAAIDQNEDGILSAEEIRQSSDALMRLDGNGDQRLSGDEIGWPPEFGPPGFGPPGFGPPEFGPPGSPPPGFGPPGFGPPGFGPGPGGFPGMESPAKPRRPDPDARPKPDFFSLEMIRSIDRNHDGRIEKGEIPKILQSKILARLDRNQDELIDESEIDSMQPDSTKE